jgi:4-amino-4-deoxy-L-arabinose transferase-like glycosyltransferase
MLSRMSYSLEGRSTAPLGAGWQSRSRTSALAARVPRPELLALMALAALLNLWALSRNGWANEYYSAAVRSMASNWHDFLYVSLDHGGVMTVDKPPLALWVQALSVRVFGFNSLSMLVPQALMGVASVALVYDLVRRRFGRVGGAVAGLALALTPIAVAVSRHNNPDALLVLCCVAAVWCAVRALDGNPTHPRTRWLVAAGVAVGLGFETKMAVAFAVVPGIVAAWLWVVPAGRGRLHALRQLLAGGGAMVLAGGAWPALVELTPASDRPWVSGTSDNRVLSLIFEYNGLGRVDGQAGGVGGLQTSGGNMFGGTPGLLRLLNAALGGQAGWLLGFALVGGLGILASSRLRRSDARTGWLLVVGGAFLTSAVLFSEASGIFHPYYVALLAPFVAALVGASAAQLIGGALPVRIVGPLAVAAGVAVELVVRGDYPEQLTWLPAVLIIVSVLAAIALVAFRTRAVRIAAVGGALAALSIVPSVWAFDTLGHAANGTFPAGGPASVVDGGGPGGVFGGLRGRAGLRAGSGSIGAVPPLFGPGGSGSSSGPAGRGPGQGGAPGGAPPAGMAGGAPTGAPRLPGGSASFGGGPGGRAGGFPGAGGPGGFGGGSIKQALAYVKAHGGGTIAVSSQSGAASAIVEGDTNVAGIGGFSGRESDVSVSWLAQEVAAGKIRWVVGEQSGAGAGFGGRLPGDTRAGSKKAMAAVEAACRKVTLPASTTTTAGIASGGALGASGQAAGGVSSSSAGTLYDCRGHANALARA